jgi:predicted nucleic acid-binding protein
MRAIRVLEALTTQRLAILSVQCLTEFFRAVRWKIAEPLTIEEASGLVERMMRTYRVLSLTPLAVGEGIRAHIQHEISYWDALIWAVAHLNEVPFVLTEDGQHGRVIEGVRYLNPFLPEFEMSMVTS